MVIDYIKKMENVISGIDNVEDTNDIFELIIEIANIFQNEIPEIKNSILLRNGTEIRDANTVIGLLKLYLANNDIEYKEESEENRKIKRFWTAFMLWFETELVNLELLKEKYVRMGLIGMGEHGIWILILIMNIRCIEALIIQNH